MALSLGKVLAVAGTAVVIAAVATSLLLIDGPDTLRAKRLDKQRVGDLRQIAKALDCYWTQEQQAALPADLSSLRATSAAFETNAVLKTFCIPGRLSDPLTDESYEYRPLDGRTYELCAEFARASDRRGLIYSGVPQPQSGSEWDHPAGHHCFRRSAVTVDVVDPTAKP